MVRSLNEENMWRILVVEDNPQVRNTCVRILKRQGYFVDQAENGLIAIDILNKEHYDLVLLDLGITKMDGIELLKHIKQNYSNLPVIMMTAFATIDTAIESLKLGAFDYIQKPFNVEEFTQTINKCLQFYKAQSEALSLKEVSGLYEVIHMIERPISEEKILLKILQKALDLSNANSGSIMLYDEDKQELEVIVDVGLRKDITRIVKLGERISGKIIAKKEPMIFHDGLKNYPELGNLETRTEIVSSISLPLIFHDKLLGVMNLNRLNAHPYKFSESELHKIQFYASYATNALMQFYTYKKLIELEQLRSEFISNVSHELRTPLMSISGAVEIMEDSTVEQQKQLIDVLKRNIKRLNTLIISLLNLSKIESGKLDYFIKPTDMLLLLKNLTEDFKLQFKTKNIDFTIELPETLPVLNIDPEKIQQAVFNLLSNALKFTDENGKVKLTAFQSEKEMIISVEDTGIGIAKEHLEKIFDKFYQINGSSTRAYPGAGIGLAITREIVLGHKGRIWVESEPNKGSKFFIVLPKK
ncbi:MAG: response regulator [Elusimicrobiota bacterium]|nr:response regulator [Elusimicrobiota bacterium]